VKKNFYDILGVHRKATPEEVEAAYRARVEALESAKPRDTNALMFVREAYQTLGDANARAAYDASLLAAARKALSRGSEAPPDIQEVQSGRPWWMIAVAAAVIAGGALWWRSRPATPPPPGPAVAASPSTAAILAPSRPGGDAPAASVLPNVPAAPASDGSATGKSAEEVFAAVSSSVARIGIEDGNGNMLGIGSGVVIANGVVITNCHVALRGTVIRVKVGSDTLNATVDVADQDFDLCRLNVPGLQMPVVAIGSVQGLRVGQRVYAIGAPQGLELTMSEGIVSALRESPIGTVIQTNAAVSPGSSGGGLFDQNGRLVGIVTFQHKFGQNLNFAVPADWIGQMRTRSNSGGTMLPGASSTKPPAADTTARATALCRELANRTAAVIGDARRRGIAPGSAITRPAQDWVRGVQDYMLHAAEQGRSLTEAELAQLGFAYCMERRPANV
jgi:S1-C subfamily serine protease